MAQPAVPLGELLGRVAADSRRRVQREPDAPRVEAKEDLRQLLLNWYGMRLPDKAVCANHVAPWTVFCEAYFATHNMILAKASRGFGGKTQFMALLALAEATTLGAEVAILGGSGTQTRRVQRAMNECWNHPGAPRHLISGDPYITKTSFVRGNVIEALTASQKAARGVHGQRLRIDEADEMDLRIFDAAMGQTMAKGDIPAQTLVMSTHHHADGTMTELVRRAADRGWRSVEWCVAEDSLVATPAGQRPISELQKGDVVYSFNGTRFVERTIDDAWSNGRRRTVRVVTTTGEVECTPDHRVLTSRGWVEAGQLRRGDRVVSLPEGGAPGVFLRGTKGVQVHDVPSVLSQDNDRQECGPSWCDGSSKGDGYRQTPLEAGAGGGGVVQGYGSCLHDFVPDWQVRGGLLLAGLPCRGGVLRASPSVAGSKPRERQAPREDHQGGRAEVRGAERPGHALVVEVAPGRVVDVWDLSVPGFNCFVANGLVVHNCYRETLEPHGWLLAAEVARKRTETTAEMWRTEIELQEPSAEGRSIDVDAVERMFRRDLGETEGLTGRTEEFEGPVPGGEYATAADWARKRDLTTIATLRHDVAPMRFVSLYRDKGAAWHVVAKRFNDRVARYGGVAIHDANGVGDNMREHLDAPDIEDYMGWQGRQRVALFSDYIAAIEAGDVVCPLSEPWYRAHRYLSNDALYGSGHPPDEFIACALAYRAARPVADEEPVRYAGAWGGARSRRPAAVEGQVATGGSWGGGRSRRR